MTTAVCPLCQQFGTDHHGEGPAPAGPGPRAQCDVTCIDCGSENVSEPDFEGFIDCFDCGAAWIPGRATKGSDCND